MPFFLDSSQLVLRPIAEALAMNKTQIVLVATGVAALVGGGTAIAAKGHSHPQRPVVHAGLIRAGLAGAPHGPGDDLEAAASYLGLSTSDLLSQLQSGKTLAQIASATSGKSTAGLIAALVAHEKQELADAVKTGQLTQAQADQITATLTQRFTDLVNGTFSPRGLGHGPGDDLEAAASYLGLSTSDLLTQLQSGKTLAQIASATSGKSTAGLIAALVAHEKQELADAVKAGRLTQAQADQVTATLTQRFTDLVNGAFPGRGPGFGFGLHGFGHGPGGDLDAAASYLGLTLSDLLTQLQSGKTLAQIAGATSGKSAAGLIAALVAHEKQELADAVNAGRLTQTQADQITAMLTQRFTDLVNGTLPVPGPRFAPRFGLRDEQPWGPPPAPGTSA
jgi:predicted RNA-binding protein associated with RNAse of E/G family